jgi:hypothetical protein
MFGPSLVEFSESVHEVFDTNVVEILRYYEGCGGRIKNCVVCCPGSCIVVVVVAQRSDQTCFLADTTVNFKVVKKVRS